MENKAILCIVELIDNEELSRRFELVGVSGEYHNFLKYVHLKYNISVTDLAKIFEVKRQTIYNYMEPGKDSLPNRVVNKLLDIYNASSIEDVIAFEATAIYYECSIPLVLDSYNTNNDTYTTIPYQQHINIYMKPEGFRASLKDEFNPSILWRNELKKTKTESIISDELPYGDELLKVFANNSEDKINRLMKLLSENEIDDELINVIGKYIDQKNNGGLLWKVTDRYEIIDNLDAIFDYGDRVLELRRSDICFKPTLQFKYEVVQLENFNINTDIKELRNTRNALIYITCTDTATIQSINTIIERVKERLSPEALLLYGITYKKELIKNVIDLYIN